MPQAHSHIMKTRLFLFSLLLICFFAGSAEARINGEVELGYTSFTADRNDLRVLDASTFYQRYSLLYNDRGRLVEGRLGHYALALGYEWGSFDTKIKTPGEEQSPSINAGHILYEGEISLTPKELPFRLKAFSRNLDRLTFQEDTASKLNEQASVIRPGIVSDMRDGLSIISGATLMVGVNNSLTNGYDSLFRELPKLYVDYRDEIHQDTKGQIKVDSRLRKLAFVSLNKKNNWFHYRTTQYDDFINTTNNSFESQIMLGTVDHTMKRQWIDLSNWIKISVDGQLTKHDEVRTIDTETYELNFFAKATRKDWEGLSLNTFTRQVDVAGVRYDQRIPLFLNGTWGKDTDWRVRTEYYSVKSDAGVYSGLVKDDYITQAQLYSFKSSPFTLSSNLATERLEATTGTSTIVSAGLETNSTQRYSREFGLGGSYNTMLIDSSQGNQFSHQHDLKGNVSYTPNPEMRIALNQTLTVAAGSREVADTALPTKQGFQGANTTGMQRSEPSLGFYRSISRLAISYIPTSSIRIGLTAAEDYYKPENLDADMISEVGSTFNFTRNNLIFDSRTVYSWRTVAGLDSSQISTSSTVKYTPQRSLEMSLQANYDRNNDSVTVTTSASVVQRLTYRRNSYYGTSRTLFDVTEELSYWRGTGGIITNTTSLGNGALPVSASENTRFSLQSNYYPIRNLYLKASAGYSLIQPESQTQFDGSAGIGIDYQKLKASLDYTYGRRDGVDKRVEKRFMANMKKYF